MKSPCYTLLLLLLTGTLATPCGPFFYAAPPPLHEYPVRHSVKVLADILKESNPKPVDAASSEEIHAQCEALVRSFEGAGDRDLLAYIEGLLRRNREGEYRPRYANFLFEVKELVGVRPKEAVQAYLEARWRMVEEDHTSVSLSLARQFALAGERETLLTAALSRAAEEQAARVRFQAGIENANARLKPHWQVQYAAWAFRNGALAEAMARFDQVLALAEKGGRQEVAWIMRARCDIEEARQVVKSGTWLPLTDPQRERVQRLRNDGEKRLETYLETYERGRFRADALGWLGAIHSDRKDYGKALTAYASQLGVKTTREVKRCALRECDRVLREMTDAIARGGEVSLADSVMASVARHPSLAILVLYHFIDPGAQVSLGFYPYREDWDGEHLRGFYAKRLVRPRRIYRKGLQVLGRELSAHKERYERSPHWNARYHVILARVAADQGAYETALRLCSGVPETDDVALTKAAILQESGDLAAAAAAYERFMETFPESPLLNDVVRLQGSRVLALSGQAGQAVRILLPSLIERNEREHTWEELYQWYDTLLLFAPLDELESAYPFLESTPRIEADFAMSFRSRALAVGDFERAKRLVRPLNDALKGNTRPLGSHYGQLDDARWDAWIDPIRTVLGKLSGAESDAELALLQFELGETWESRRGYLTLPDNALGDRQYLMHSEDELLWLRRRVNAAELGISQTDAQVELDRRDEAWHAHEAYAEAARLSKGRPLEARALEAANRCLRLMAELNPYQATRAFERRDDLLSRTYYDRLQSGHPETNEAKQAAYWTFDSPLGRAPWMPGDNAPWIAEQKILEGFDSNPPDDRSSGGRFDRLVRERTLGNEALLAQLDDLEASLLSELESPVDGLVIDRIEHLRVFLRHHPKASPDLRRRLGSSQPVEGILPDFIAFNKIASADQLEREQEIDAWEGFLKEYANSAKCEAARLRHTRLVVRQYRTHVGVRAFHWPAGAPILKGYKHLRVRRDQPFDEKAVFGALEAYEKAYPQGRYLAECAVLRGGALMDIGDWGASMDVLLGVLDDRQKGDLHLEAGLNLAALFMTLLEPESRPDIVRALKERPAAQVRLKQFMQSESCGSRLLLMEDFLDQD